jgi:hypothetical protein
MEFFIPWWGKAKLAVAAIVGSVAGGVLVITYVSVFTIPAAKKEAAKIAQAEMLEKFKEVSNELASDAEKFRANRLACRAVGGVFDFSSGDCKK